MRNLDVLPTLQPFRTHEMPQNLILIMKQRKIILIFFVRKPFSRLRSSHNWTREKKTEFTSRKHKTAEKIFFFFLYQKPHKGFMYFKIVKSLKRGMNWTKKKNLFSKILHCLRKRQRSPSHCQLFQY